MQYAAIGPIAIHLPQKVETNDDLQAEFPNWNLELIYAKTGIRARHIAAPNECASDLGVAAAEKLFAEHKIDRSTIDYLLFCTQTPDYPLPTTACLVQHRLGLPTSIGALDFNLGCSGFVYGLSLADGLIRAGAARRVLLITAETYSKYIAPSDRSLRTIFGDGAAATLIEASETSLRWLGVCLWHRRQRGRRFVRAHRRCPLARGGPQTVTPNGGWPSKLYMDGPGILTLTMEIIPNLVQAGAGRRRGWSESDIDLFLLHQATFKLLDALRQQMKIEAERVPIALESCGNTVSSTIPLLLHDLRASGRLRRGTRSLLAGFGVGFSWAGCLSTETWDNKAVKVGERAA